MRTLKPWLICMLCTVGAFTLVLMASMLGAEAARLWSEPAAGFCSALAVVLTAYVSAPVHKQRAAGAAFLLGAALAWYLLRGAFYPESYRALAYQPTMIPLLATLAGGALGLLLTGLLARRRARLASTH